MFGNIHNAFSRSFSLANTASLVVIKVGYENVALTLAVPRHEEAKPKQIKVNVGTPAVAVAAGAK